MRYCYKNQVPDYIALWGQPESFSTNPNKENFYKISAVIPFMREKKATKRNILSELSSVYNPINLSSPAHLLGKLLHHEMFDLKLLWDETVPPLFKQKWKGRNLDISCNRVKIPRFIPTKTESVTVINIQVFGDASIREVTTI